MKSVIDGSTVAGGCIYLPSQEKAEKWRANLSEEKKEKERYFREVEAPQILIELEERLKGYEIDDQGH